MKALQSRSVREGQRGGFLGQNSIMFLLDPGASSSFRYKAERVDSTCGQDNAWSLCWRCSILSTSLPNECVRPLAGCSRSDLLRMCHGPLSHVRSHNREVGLNISTDVN